MPGGGSMPYFASTGTEVGMRLAIGHELVDKVDHQRLVLVESLDDAARPAARMASMSLRVNAGLPVKINRERAADDDEREQQHENLVAQARRLRIQLGVRISRGFINSVGGGFGLDGLEDAGQFRAFGRGVVGGRVVGQRLDRASGRCWRAVALQAQLRAVRGCGSWSAARTPRRESPARPARNSKQSWWCHFS